MTPLLGVTPPCARSDVPGPPGRSKVAAFLRTARLVVPGRSAGFVRIGMIMRKLLDQGARKSHPDRPAAKLILPVSEVLRPRWYAVEPAAAIVRGGRVRGIILRDDSRINPYRAAGGLTPSSSPSRVLLRRLAPGAACRSHPGNPALVDLRRIGPSTWWGPEGNVPGFFVIWPGARAAKIVVVDGRRVTRPDGL